LRFPGALPYYRHLYIGETAETALEETPPPISGEQVERYVSIQAQIKALQEELEVLRQEIIDYCKAEEVNRVYGPENQITYQLAEMTGFNEDDVRALLEPENLWERVIGFDQSRLKQLLNDEAVARDIRDRIKSLRQVISTSQRLLVKKRQDEDKEV